MSSSVKIAKNGNMQLSYTELKSPSVSNVMDYTRPNITDSLLGVAKQISRLIH